MIKNVADLSHFFLTHNALVKSKLFVILSVFLLPIKMLYLIVFCITDYFTFYFLGPLSYLLSGNRGYHGYFLTSGVFLRALNRL